MKTDIADVSDETLVGLARDQLASPELSQYGAFADQILENLRDRLEIVRNELAPYGQILKSQRATLNTAQNAYGAFRRKVRLALSGPLIAAVALTLGYLAERVLDDPSFLDVPKIAAWTEKSRQLTFILFFAGCAALLYAFYWYLTSGNSDRARKVLLHQSAVYSEESRFESFRRVSVTAVLRSTINDVELDSSKIVESDTVRAVRRLVDQHAASAVGLAGPRGVGKSTILRALAVSNDEQLGVYVHSPVRYDPGDFLRRLFEETLLAARSRRQIAARPPTLYLKRRAERRQNSLRLFVVAVVGMTGLGAFAIGSTSPPRLNSYQVMGFTLGALAAVLGVIELSKALDSGRDWRMFDLDSDREITVIADALASLRWRTELGRSSTTEIKPFGGMFDVSEEDSTKESSVDRTHAELVAEFRRFLRDYQRASNLTRVIIAVDELDKLGTATELIKAVNGLKDLLHIEGTHFLVSVSTDALDNFALRGIPARDAFDSSFDTIVSVKRLDARQSVSVLESRATGFPLALALFCHAWSGGLPRDLLRAARGCIDSYVAWPNTSVEELVQRYMQDSVERTVAAYARSVGGGGRPHIHATISSTITALRAGAFTEAAASIVPLAELDATSDISIIYRYILVAERIRSAMFLGSLASTTSELSDADISEANRLAVEMAAVGDEEVALLANINWPIISAEDKGNTAVGAVVTSSAKHNRGAKDRAATRQK